MSWVLVGQILILELWTSICVIVAVNSIKEKKP